MILKGDLMGFLVNTIYAIEEHWKEKSYNIYSILLGKDFNGLDANDMYEMLNLIHKITGKKACCYYFTPKSWNPKDFSPYDIKNIIGKHIALKQSIIKGTKEFEKLFHKKLRDDSIKKKFIPALTKEGKIWSFKDLGIFFFNRSEVSSFNDCFYIPISKINWREQLRLMLKQPTTYDDLMNHIKKKQDKLYRLINNEDGMFKFKHFKTGINIIKLVLSIL